MGLLDRWNKDRSDKPLPEDWWMEQADDAYLFEQLSPEPTSFGTPELADEVLRAALQADDAGFRFRTAVKLAEVIRGDTIRQWLGGGDTFIGPVYTLWNHYEDLTCLGFLPSSNAGYTCVMFERKNAGDPLKLAHVYKPRVTALAMPLVLNIDKLPSVATDGEDSAERFLREWTLTAVRARGGKHHRDWFPEDNLRDLRETRTTILPKSWEDGWDRVLRLGDAGIQIFRVFQHEPHHAAYVLACLRGRWPARCLKFAATTAFAMFPGRHQWTYDLGAARLLIYCGSSETDHSAPQSAQELVFRTLRHTKALLLRTRMLERGISLPLPDARSAIPRPEVAVRWPKETPDLASVADYPHQVSGEGWTKWWHGWGNERDRHDTETTFALPGWSNDTVLQAIRNLEGPDPRAIPAVD